MRITGPDGRSLIAPNGWFSGGRRAGSSHWRGKVASVIGESQAPEEEAGLWWRAIRCGGR